MTGTTCFLVDDDTDDQEIFALALEEVDRSISCIVAQDGVQAIDMLSNQDFKPHYIFLDINMPRMNGMQCLEKIRKMSRLQDVPVVMYSTASDPVYYSETKRLGAAEFIVKPASIPALTDALSRFFTASER
jgi:CheY-like chemotaxis protein